MAYIVQFPIFEIIVNPFRESKSRASTQPDRTGSMISLHSPTIPYQHNLIGLVQ